jgi:hypothetical protein
MTLFEVTPEKRPVPEPCGMLYLMGWPHTSALNRPRCRATLALLEIRCASTRKHPIVPSGSSTYGFSRPWSTAAQRWLLTA